MCHSTLVVRKMRVICDLFNFYFIQLFEWSLLVISPYYIGSELFDVMCKCPFIYKPQLGS